MDIDDIVSVLKRIDSKIDERIRILIIGGSAMAIFQEKVVTKDIDCAIPDDESMMKFVQCAREIGFETDPHQGLDEEKGIILKNPNGFRIDVFAKRICNKFFVHEGIMKRAVKLKDFSNIQVYVMSREDIFISKSITERDVDLSDMFGLYKTGMDQETIIVELDTQSRMTGLIWEAFMTVKLDEIEERFDVTIPLKNRIRSIAEDKLADKFE